MTRRRDEESGRYQQEYADEEILAVLESTRLSTKEVAEELGCHRTTAHERLVEMEEEGTIESTPVGNTLIWEAV